MTVYQCQCGGSPCGHSISVDRHAYHADPVDDTRQDLVLTIRVPEGMTLQDLLDTLKFYLTKEKKVERRVTLTTEDRLRLVAELAPELVESLKDLEDFVTTTHANSKDEDNGVPRDQMRVEWPANQKKVDEARKLLKAVRAVHV